MLSPAFLRLTIYRGCITLAYQILTVTAGWHIYALTHDVVALGLIGLAGGPITLKDPASWEPSYGRPAEAEERYYAMLDQPAMAA